MGATGALLMARARRRLSVSLLRQALKHDRQAGDDRLFIMSARRVFSWPFYGVKTAHRMGGRAPADELARRVSLAFLIVVTSVLFVPRYS